MIKKQWYMVLLTFLLVFASGFSTQATEKIVTVTEAEATAPDLSKVEAVKDSVVQVVLQYTDAEGNKYLLKSGSGFLISDSDILTNYQNVILTDEEREMASKFISEQTGKEVEFRSDAGSEAGYQVGIAVYRDVVFTATVNSYSSKEMDLAILNITDSLNRTVATLGDSEELENETPVYALGYKEVSVMTSGETELLSQDDCREKEGVVSKIIKESQVKYISHTCDIHKGNKGGPLVDGSGNVLGMNVYVETENPDATSFRALGINEIKGLLDNCRITYKEAGIFLDDTSLTVEPEETEEKEEVNTNLLDNYIVSFSMLQQADYTPESFANLTSALSLAKELKNDEDVTQEEIDKAVAQLEVAKNGLVIQPKTNWTLIIIIISVAVIFLVVIVILILYILGVIGHKEERESLRTLQDMTNASRENLAGSNSGNMYNPNMGMASMPQQNMPRSMPRGMANSGGNDGTTVLGNSSFGQEQGTMLLGSYGTTRSSAYLTRMKTSEKINLDTGEFIIGKGTVGTNYCIMDNPTVSREHAKIMKRGGSYFVVDLNSTNSTYLNGRLLHPGEEVALASGNIICLSDEEFIFQEM